jgi:hypothetical protein
MRVQEGDEMRLERVFPYVAGLALAVLTCTTVVVKAQTIISNETLKTTTFVVNKVSSTAKCLKRECVEISPMFAPIPVTCPAAMGHTCTFHISLDAKVSVSGCPKCEPGFAGTGFFQFLVDGAAPTIGPTDENGNYLFQKNVATFLRPYVSRQSKPASVLGGVTNSTSSNHTITVNLGCRDSANTGICVAVAHWSTMRVDVFEP